MNSADLAELFIETDLGSLFLRHRGALVGYASKLLDGHDAEDLVQDVFTKLAASGKSLDDRGALSFLYRSVQNAVASVKRSGWYKHRATGGSQRPGVSPPEPPVFRQGGRRKSARAVSPHPEEFRHHPPPEQVQHLHSKEVAAAVRELIDPNSLEGQVYDLFTKGVTLSDMESVLGIPRSRLKWAWNKLQRRVRQGIGRRWGEDPLDL